MNPDIILSDEAVVKLRLILSTFQDGSGMLNGGRLPGWRDFERAVASVLQVEALESKYVFDVIVEKAGSYRGVSCKMGNTFDGIESKDRILLELSNSSKDFQDGLESRGIPRDDWKIKPQDAGNALLSILQDRYKEEGRSIGVEIDYARSCHLILSYSLKLGLYQLFQFPLILPTASGLIWSHHTSTKSTSKGHLRGIDATSGQKIFEWYADSGGQFKYWPSVSQAIWKSNPFHLEPLPSSIESASYLENKARSYFQTLWPD